MQEAIQLDHIFRFGWLNHHGSGNRETHSWGMESMIHESFGDVIHTDARAFCYIAQIDDAFMGNKPIFALVEDGKMRI